MLILYYWPGASSVVPHIVLERRSPVHIKDGMVREYRSSNLRPYYSA
jgi:hypothetical protein